MMHRFQHYVSCEKCRMFALIAILTSICIFNTGCTVSQGLKQSVQSNDKIITHSVVNQTIPEGVLETDAEVIKSVVADAKGASQTQPLAWNNPQTGTSGSIVAINNFLGKHGQKCRGFKTTVDNFMGISFYNGEACQISAKEWVLSWFQSIK